MSAISDPTTEKVILIENDFAEPGWIIQSLSEAGFTAQVVQVTSPAEFTQALSPIPDLILAGLSSKPLSIPWILEQLQSQDLSIPLVILCSADQEDTAACHLATGAADYLLANDARRLGAIASRERRRADLHAVSEIRERNLRLLIENTPAAIAMFDRDMHYLAVSRQYRADYHLGDVEIIGRSHYDVFPEIPERWKEIHRRCLAGGVESCEEDPFPRSDGTLDWVRWEIHPWQEKPGQIGGIILFSEVTTERKRAEDALREAMDAAVQSQTRLQLIANNTEDVVWSADANSLHFQYVTPSVQRFLGYTPDEMLQRTVFDLIPIEAVPLLQEQYRARLQAFCSGDESQRVRVDDFDAVRKDGSRVAVELVTTLIPDEQGKVRQVVGVSRDITDRQRSEQLLRENEEKFRALVELSPDCVAVHADGKIVYINPSGVRLLGAGSADELLGRSVIDLILPEDRPMIYQRFVEVAQGKSALPLEERFVLPDGSLVEGEISAAPILYQGKPATLIVGRDTTESKRAHARLRQSEEDLQKAQAVAHVGSWRWNIQSNQLEWSDEMYRIFGIDRAGFTGYLPDVIAKAIHPDDRERVEASNRSVFDHGKPIPLEYRVVHPDGEVRWVWGEAGEVLLDQEGKPAYLTGIIQDITPRKHAEAVLRESEEKFHTIFSESPIGIELFGPDGRLREVNRACQEIAGVIDPAELSGFQLFDDPNLPLGTHQLLTAKKTISMEVPFNFELVKANHLYRTNRSGVAHFSVVITALSGGGNEVQGYLAMIQDITERKRAEKRLEGFRLLFDQSRDIFMTSRFSDRRILEANPAAERAYGYSREELLQRTIYDLRSPETLAQLDSKLQQVNHEGILYETQHRRKDGSTFPVEVNMIITEFEGERVLLSVLRDISERKLADDALRSSEAKYRSLFSEMMSACALHEMIFDQDGNAVDYITLDANPAYMVMLNTYPEEVIGKKASEILPPEELSRWLAVFGPVAAGGPGVPYELFSPLNGKYFSGSVYSPETGKFAITFTDITAYRLAEKGLRESETRFRALIEQAPQAIIISRHGKPIYANPHFLEMMGYADMRACLETAIIENVSPSDRPAAPEVIQPSDLGGEIPYNFEVHLVRQDGSEFPVNISITPIQLSDGPANLTFIADITAQKLAEAEIRRQADHANALAELTGRLSTALDQSEVVEELARCISTSMGLDACVVYLLNEEIRVLYPTVSTGLPEETWQALVPLPARYDSVDDWFPLTVSRVDPERSKVPGLVLCPMVYQDQLVGAVGIPDRGERYPADERQLVEGFARQAAITLANLRLYEETRDRAAELQKLAEVSASLRQARNINEIISVLSDQICQALVADSSALILFAEETGGLHLSKTITDPAPEWHELLGGASLEILARNVQGYFTAAAHQEALAKLPFRWESSPLVSVAGAVVRTVEATIGLLLVGYTQPHSFKEEEQRLLLAIADMAGNAIQRTNIVDTLEGRIQTRTRELKVLYELARAATRLSDLDTMLDQSLGQVLDIYHAQYGVIQLLSKDGKSLELAAHSGLPDPIVEVMQKIPLAESLASRPIGENQVIFIEDVTRRFQEVILVDQLKMYLGAPIRAKGEILGAISISDTAPIRYSPDEVALLETIANQIGISLESARLRKRSEEAAILEERQRLARDLHDSVTQSLFSLNMLAEGFRRQLPQAQKEDLEEWFSELGASAHQALKDMRLLLYELRPSTIEHDGFVTALRRRLEAVESRAGIKSQFKIEGDPSQIAIFDAVELYHIAQEALNNALKHAQASSVQIRLVVGPGSIHFVVQDDGVGFDLENIETEGMGLNNMVERARRMSGTLTIQSRPGDGTVVSLQKGGENA
jgi:PAS domain S-box-containing protein